MSRSQSSFVPTSQYRGLRACMVCSIVQHSSKFFSDGCPNCEEYINIKGSQEGISEATSQVFEGLITLADPKKSWVAKWQRLDGYEPGMYAVKVVGILPDEIMTSLEENGVKYIPRDGSAGEEDGS